MDAAATGRALPIILFFPTYYQEYIIEGRESILLYYSTVYQLFMGVSDLCNVIHKLRLPALVLMDCRLGSVGLAAVCVYLAIHGTMLLGKPLNLSSCTALQRSLTPVNS